MPNILSTAILPIGTKKGEVVMINCLPFVVCDELPDCPCREWQRCPDDWQFYFVDNDGNKEPVDEHCNATHVTLPIEYRCCGEPLSVRISAENPVHIGDALYTPNNTVDVDVPEIAMPTNQSADGLFRWGIIYGFATQNVSQYDSIGNEDALAENGTGEGLVWAVMLEPCCECHAAQADETSSS